RDPVLVLLPLLVELHTARFGRVAPLDGSPSPLLGFLECRLRRRLAFASELPLPLGELASLLNIVCEEPLALARLGLGPGACFRFSLRGRLLRILGPYRA